MMMKLIVMLTKMKMIAMTLKMMQTTTRMLP